MPGKCLAAVATALCALGLTATAAPTARQQRQALINLDSTTGCGRPASAGIPGSGMGGCSNCALGAETNPARYDWSGTTRPTSCNPTHHTEIGGCYDWWGIRSVRDAYGRLFRERCDAFGSNSAAPSGQPGSTTSGPAASVVTYNRFAGRWEKIGRAAEYSATTAIEWSSEYSDVQARTFTNSLAATRQDTASSSISYEFGYSNTVTVGASTAVSWWGVEAEVSAEASTTLSASAGGTATRQHSAANTAAREWSRQVERTFSRTTTASQELSCGNAKCTGGDLWMWTVAGIAGAPGAERRDTTRSCLFACVPHDSAIRAPSCPIEYCGNTECTCCSTNSWANDARVASRIPVCDGAVNLLDATRNPGTTCSVAGVQNAVDSTGFGTQAGWGNTCSTLIDGDARWNYPGQGFHLPAHKSLEFAFPRAYKLDMIQIDSGLSEWIDRHDNAQSNTQTRSIPRSFNVELQDARTQRWETLRHFRDNEDATIKIVLPNNLANFWASGLRIRNIGGSLLDQYVRLGQVSAFGTGVHSQLSR